jgi:hypothetical protein
MEQWVRVRNERDRQILMWLIRTVGEGALVEAAKACSTGESKPYLSAVHRYLGISVPKLAIEHIGVGKVGEEHLQAIYQILHRSKTQLQRTGSHNA